jgi:hypothetical protein
MAVLFVFAIFGISAFTIHELIFNDSFGDKIDYIVKICKFTILLKISTTGVFKKARRLKRREWNYLCKGSISEYVEEYVDELIEFCSFVSRNKESLNPVSGEIESICQEAEQIYLDLREYVINPTVRRSLTRVVNKQDCTESDYRAYDMMEAVLDNATNKTNDLRRRSKDLLNKALKNESIEIDKIVDNWKNGISIGESTFDFSVSEKEDSGSTDLSNDDNKTEDGQSVAVQNDLSDMFNEFSSPLWDEKDADDDEDADRLIPCSSVA